MPKSPSNFKAVMGLLTLGAFFISINVFDFAKPVKNFFFTVSEPAERLLWQKGADTKGFFSGLFRPEDLKTEVNNLRLENQDLLGQIASLKAVREENNILRQAFGLNLQKEFDLILAQVVSKDFSQDSILIDKGARDNIKKGSPVVTSQKFLVGRVGEVYEDFSEVILITNKNSSFDATVINTAASDLDSQIYSVAKGRSGFQIGLDFIPKETEFSKDSLVVTSALGRIFPEGLVVGKIKEVKNSDLDSFQIAEIEPGFGIQNIDKLFVITNFIF